LDEPRDLVIERHAEHLFHGRFADVRCLPDLGQLVPDVIRVGAARDVGAPRLDEVRPGPGEALRVAATPVVPDQIDRPVDLFEFVDEPAEVVVRGGREARRHGRSESGR
jgi:hypothetical protein